MNTEECIEYIMNFDENKLFHTELDDKYTNKITYIEMIKKAKQKFKQYKKPTCFDMVKAFKFCGMYLTDTPHQAIAKYICKALNPKFYETEMFLKYVVEELKRIDEVEE